MPLLELSLKVNLNVARNSQNRPGGNNLSKCEGEMIL
jgi:hypothetical protein